MTASRPLDRGACQIASVAARSLPPVHRALLPPFAIVMGLLLCGCDPLPVTMLRNGAARPVKFEPVHTVPLLGDPRDGVVAVASGGRIRIANPFGRLAVAAGDCDYVYLVPKGSLDSNIGAVNRLEVGADMRLYFLSGGGRRASPQPPPWPLEPAERVCP